MIHVLGEALQYLGALSIPALVLMHRRIRYLELRQDFRRDMIAIFRTPGFEDLPPQERPEELGTNASKINTLGQILGAKELTR